MDLADKQSLSVDDIFEESLFANRLFLHHRELSDHFSEKQPLDFNIQESIDHFIIKEQMPLPLPLHYEECQSIRNDLEADDTNQFETDSKHKPHTEPLPENNIHTHQNQGKGLEDLYVSNSVSKEHTPDIQKLQTVIGYLVQHPKQSVQEVWLGLGGEFKQVLQSGVVIDLVQKFNRLKKTKEELIKYCMRKAFKFILQLPKNKHLLQVDRAQKFSFSKCKNRFLKNISDEKSMNNKFLQQIFQEKDFSSDYHLFLAKFESIIQEDNDKKVKYLADLLTTHKEGRSRTVQMVKRLPWTRIILEKVRKISKQLLKYSDYK